MRIEATARCLTWIPPLAVEGTFKLPFRLGISHYDAPPPDEVHDVDALVAADAIRFANELTGWIEVDRGRITAYGANGRGHFGTTRLRVGPFGTAFAAVPLPEIRGAPEVHPDRVRFVQTAGGHTGVAVPRRIAHPPFVRLSAPIAWSTVSLTIGVDGSRVVSLDAASPFPRHYLYDTTGQLIGKTGLIRYGTWIRQAEETDTPWGGVSNVALFVGVNSGAERALANAALMSHGYVQHALEPGALLREIQLTESQLNLLLDGILVIDLDETPVSEVGPGAIFDPVLRTPLSRQHARVRARTACRVAVIERSLFDTNALLAVSREQTSRLESRWRMRDFDVRRNAG
jgi:hypothetical protein